VYTRSGGVWTQQGGKLVGAGAVGSAQQGVSVALSVDGNTAIIGGPDDNANAGAAWVYTRSGGVWTQQGGKLVGTGAVGGAQQGVSVALSGDGNTAIVGGNGDNSAVGAAWVFTRSGNVWSQQGGKLVGTGAVGGFQGESVALSADGNTAIIGGMSVNASVGAAWVFTRSGNVWSQQGGKLVGTGAVGQASQGYSVALSGEGNTAVVGAWNDNANVGAAWVFTRSGGVWTQQGGKLVGTGAAGSSDQGISVALSADGNTAIVGGLVDNNSIGAAWVFTRSGSEWSQMGSKLVGTGAVGSAQQGRSVALSADGNTAVVGGSGDNGSVGAAWVFVNPTPMPTLTAGTAANGATYLSGGLVPGSWAQVKGSNLATVSRIWTAADFTGLGNNLPTNLSGTSVNVNGLPAAVYFADPGQVSFQIPAGVSGTASVQVFNNGVASNTVSGAAANNAPGIFPIIVNGTNYPAGVFLDGLIAGDPSNGSAFRKAKPGDVIQLFATGLAPSAAGVLVGFQAVSGVTVTIGNVAIPADAAGLVAVGEFQINFTVPQQFASLPEGNYPLTISVNGATSPVTINSNPPGQIVLPIQH
jgi:uncharacterized protein (TIGR03437 family)